jgi:hypothetical protein
MAGIKPGIFHIFRFLSLSLFRQAIAAPGVVIETLLVCFMFANHPVIFYVKFLAKKFEINTLLCFP